jgi:hypothetical protein
MFQIPLHEKTESIIRQINEQSALRYYGRGNGTLHL